jgi:hypothetical protein
MKTPTLEEVENRYANAKEVRCVSDDKIYDLTNFKRIIKGESPFENNSFLAVNDEFSESEMRKIENYVVLYSINNSQYAEIISYKSNPNIDLSKLTPELITELCKEPNIKEFMINNGVVTEPKKEETYIKVPLSIITLTESNKKLGKIVKNLAKNV